MGLMLGAKVSLFMDTDRYSEGGWGAHNASSPSQSLGVKQGRMK